MKVILLCLFSFMVAVLAQIGNRFVDFAAIGPVTRVCSKVENVPAEMSEIIKFLIVNSFDVMMVRIKAANIILIAKIEAIHDELSCTSSGINCFFYCTLRCDSIPLDAHMLTHQFNLRKSIVKRAFLLKRMNVILEAQKQNGIVSITKVGAVVDGFEETKMNTDLNKTVLTEWMGAVISHFVSSASCAI